MRTHVNTKKLEVVCNCCEKRLSVENGIVMEGVLRVQAEWGYFSKKDGEVHSFDICEDCYDKWITGFKIPIDIVRKTEML